MSSFSTLDTSVLRETVNPPLTTKGSELTYAEGDARIINIYNAVQDIVSGVNVTAYDAGTSYDYYSTDPATRFASYDGRIWSAIYNGSPSSFSGQTPAESSYWTQVSLAELLPNIIDIARLVSSGTGAALKVETVTTTAAQPIYSVPNLSGKTIKKVWYGEQVLTPAYYTFVGTTFTLMFAGTIDAGVEIFILYV